MWARFSLDLSKIYRKSGHGSKNSDTAASIFEDDIRKEGTTRIMYHPFVVYSLEPTERLELPAPIPYHEILGELTGEYTQLWV